METPNGRSEIEGAFGNQANSDGTLNEAWEGANIRKVAPRTVGISSIKRTPVLYPSPASECTACWKEVFVAQERKQYVYRQTEIVAVSHFAV